MSQNAKSSDSNYIIILTDYFVMHDLAGKIFDRWHQHNMTLLEN